MRRDDDFEIEEDLPHPEPKEWPYVAVAADAYPEPPPKRLIDSLLMQRLELVAIGFAVVMALVQALRGDHSAEISAGPVEDGRPTATKVAGVTPNGGTERVAE